MAFGAATAFGAAPARSINATRRQKRTHSSGRFILLALEHFYDCSETDSVSFIGCLLVEELQTPAKKISTNFF